MGGSSGSGKLNTKNAPPAGAEMNFSSLMDQSRAFARESSALGAQQARDQYAAMVANYPAMEELQLGTAQRIAGLLNNAYTADARTATKEGLALTPLMNEQGNRLAGLGAGVAEISRRTAATGPTSIEQELYRQAESDLMLGRTLSAAENRDAQQSARAAFAARGLATSLGSSAAEILNRDQLAQARESDRRNFAGATNQQYLSNCLAIQDQAARQAGLAGDLMGNASNVYGNSANVSFGGARTMVDIDPMARALGLGSAYSGQNMQAGTSLINNAYQNAGSMMNAGFGNAASAASFNTNLLDTRRNSYMNNQASLQAARMQAGAMNRSATMGMLGSAIQGGIQAGGMVGAAQFAPAMFSDQRMKKDIKPLGKAGSVLGLTAYEYSYKDDDQKRVGFMAQDVQKVLPEAVTEVDYKGKKRLAIKPAVIGAALAEELMAAKAA